MRVCYFDIVKFVEDLIRKEGIKKRKLKIMLATHSFFYGGVDKVVRLQAKDLSEAGHDVTILTLRGNLDVPNNVKLEILGCPRNFFICMIYELFFFLDLFKLIRWIPRLRDYDLVICHHNSVAWLAYFAKKLYSKSLIFVYQNHSPMINSRELFPNIIQRFYMFLKIYTSKYLVKRADYVISVSNYSRKELKKVTGVDSIVVYNKVDSTKLKFKSDGMKIRKKYNLGADPVILFVGRIIPQKKVDLLVQAFKLVKTKIPNAKLLIVGEGDKNYLKSIKKLCDDSVIFAGYVPEEDLPKYYHACDLFATCSIWESFNLTVVEAQLCGKPVVAFDIGAHRETVKSGYLVKKGDIEKFAEIITCLLKTKKWRRKLGRGVYGKEKEEDSVP